MGTHVEPGTAGVEEGGEGGVGAGKKRPQLHTTTPLSCEQRHHEGDRRRLHEQQSSKAVAKACAGRVQVYGEVLVLDEEVGGFLAEAPLESPLATLAHTRRIHVHGCSLMGLRFGFIVFVYHVSISCSHSHPCAQNIFVYIKNIYLFGAGFGIDIYSFWWWCCWFAIAIGIGRAFGISRRQCLMSH